MVKRILVMPNMILDQFKASWTGQRWCLLNGKVRRRPEAPNITMALLNTCCQTSYSQHCQNHIGCYWPPIEYSIHQESLISPPWRIQDDIVWGWLLSKFSIPQESPILFTLTMHFPSSIRALLSPLLSFITCSWTGDLSLSLELGQKPDHCPLCYVYQTGGPPLSQPLD